VTDLPQPPPRRRVQRRAGRPRTLDREAVVDAALRVLDAEGLDAVTIRRVAEELGTSGTALYTYVRDKDELVDLLVDRVIGEVDFSRVDASKPWQEQVREFAREARRTFVAHRDVARATLGRIPQGENALVAMNEMLGRLRAAEVPEQVISFGTDLLSLYVGAVAYEESLMVAQGLLPESVESFVGELRTYFKRLPPDRFPHIVALADALTAGSPSEDERFEFGLDVIVAGLAARAELARQDEQPGDPEREDGEGEDRVGA
jgi:AcrR family transcriptional regulator